MPRQVEFGHHLLDTGSGLVARAQNHPEPAVEQPQTYLEQPQAYLTTALNLPLRKTLNLPFTSQLSTNTILIKHQMCGSLAILSMYDYDANNYRGPSSKLRKSQ